MLKCIEMNICSNLSNWLLLKYVDFHWCQNMSNCLRAEILPSEFLLKHAEFNSCWNKTNWTYWYIEICRLEFMLKYVELNKCWNMFISVHIEICWIELVLKLIETVLCKNRRRRRRRRWRRSVFLFQTNNKNTPDGNRGSWQDCMQNCMFTIKVRSCRKKSHKVSL